MRNNTLLLVPDGLSHVPKSFLPPSLRLTYLATCSVGTITTVAYVETVHIQKHVQAYCSRYKP